MAKFWMLLVEGTGSCRHQHETEAEAKEEAERLAGLPGNLGKKVYFLEATAYCEVRPKPVTWSALERR